LEIGLDLYALFQLETVLEIVMHYLRHQREDVIKLLLNVIVIIHIGVLIANLFSALEITVQRLYVLLNVVTTETVTLTLESANAILTILVYHVVTLVFLVLPIVQDKMENVIL